MSQVRPETDEKPRAWLRLATWFTVCGSKLELKSTRVQPMMLTDALMVMYESLTLDEQKDFVAALDRKLGERLGEQNRKEVVRRMGIKKVNFNGKPL